MKSPLNYTESQFTTQKKRAASDPNLRKIGEKLLHFFFKGELSFFMKQAVFSPAIAVHVHSMIQRETARGANTSTVIGCRVRTLAWPGVSQRELGRSRISIKRDRARGTLKGLRELA